MKEKEAFIHNCFEPFFNTLFRITRFLDVNDLCGMRLTPLSHAIERCEQEHIDAMT